MSNVLTWVKSRLEHRGDSEHGQALIRVALISIILVYALLPSSRAALPTATLTFTAQPMRWPFAARDPPPAQRA